MRHSDYGVAHDTRRLVQQYFGQNLLCGVCEHEFYGWCVFIVGWAFIVLESIKSLRFRNIIIVSIAVHIACFIRPQPRPTILARFKLSHSTWVWWKKKKKKKKMSYFRASWNEIKSSNRSGFSWRSVTLVRCETTLRYIYYTELRIPGCHRWLLSLRTTLG